MKKVIKYIGIMFAFIFGFFIVGNKDNVSALDSLNYYHEMLNSPVLYPNHIWTDDSNIYYSYSGNQYELDKSTNTWNTKTWNGLSFFSGDCIWTDGESIYYSNNSLQYELDKSTNTWNTKVWNGLDSFRGSYIWTDGNNIYYSQYSSQYVLDKSTSTWNVITWEGYTSFYGSCIWTDGENIYCSENVNNQHILDKSTNTWNTYTWNLEGFTGVNGSYIWTDGENIYYSDNSLQYELDKSTSTWKKKLWEGLNIFTRSSIWKYENNYYVSANYVTFRFDYESTTGGYTEQDLINAKQEGIEEGKASVDITTDNQSYAEQYIQDNNYHTNEDYLSYGESKHTEGYNKGYTAGQESVDITTDNQSYAEQYIQDNNYHTNEEYLNYGNNQYAQGADTATTSNLNIVKNKVSSLFPDETLSVYACTTTTSGSKICDDSFKNYIQDTYNMSYSKGVNSVDITTDNQSYAEQYIIDNNYYTNEEYLNYGSEKSAEGYTQGRADGKAEGYQKANDDGKILGGFIPSLLGGFGSFFLTIMNIDILGFNLLTIFGIFITICSIVIVIKFLKG